MFAERKGLFCLLALGVVILSFLLLWEINRRMTAARNNNLVLLNFLIKHCGVDVVGITGSSLPEKYELNYDKQELRFYALILSLSALPAVLLWRI